MLYVLKNLIAKEVSEKGTTYHNGKHFNTVKGYGGRQNTKK